MQRFLSEDQLGEVNDNFRGAGAATEDLKGTKVALALTGAIGVCGVLGASFALTTYAAPLPMLAGTVVSGGLLFAGLKGTEFEVVEDSASLSSALFPKKEKVDSVATPPKEKDVAVKATTEEKSSS